MGDVSLSVAAFYVLAALAVVGGAGVAFSRNIVYSALSLMASFLGVAGLYVLLSADFLAAVQVILYVGGVLVLIIFAVMLTERLAERKLRAVNEQKGIALIVGVLLLLLLVGGLSRGAYKVHQPRLTVAEAAPEIEVEISLEKGRLKTEVTDRLEELPGGAPLNEGAMGTTEAVGRALMTDYVLPFEMASLLLLAAMVGAILFTRREDDGGTSN